MNSGRKRAEAESWDATGALQEDLAGTPYRLIAQIGQGGMGAVFEVEHALLGRRLVLKILRFSRRPDLEDRLRFEAQTLAQLSHPNLLTVLDFGRTRSGRPFIVTELLSGRTLKALLAERGSLTVPEAVDCALQALAGLASAHRAGVVHRDVKTDNLFVCDRARGGVGTIKVIDFGIAKLGAGSHADLRASIHPLEVPTADGTMVGTPSFMAPEQICANQVDQRADIFGMGMVLYRLLSGRGPFDPGDVIATMRANVRDVAPPPSSFASQHVPPELDTIVLRAIAKRRRDRFQSATEMALALAPFAASPKARPLARTSTVRLKKVSLPLSRPPSRNSQRLLSHRPLHGLPPRAAAVGRSSARSCGARPTLFGWLAFLLALLFAGCSTLTFVAWLGWT